MKKDSKVPDTDEEEEEVYRREEEKQHVHSEDTSWRRCAGANMDTSHTHTAPAPAACYRPCYCCASYPYPCASSCRL
jgi:hypothetical protein